MGRYALFIDGGYLDKVRDTFKVYLPRAGDAPKGESVRPSTPAPRIRPSETILVVEDEAQLLLLVKNVLRRAGYTVLEAAGPAEAVLVSEQHPGKIDLLLTDVVMPKMNGKQLADRLQGTRPDMKVAFMSGYTANVVVHHGMVDPGFVLIQKPLTPAVLLAEIEKILSPTIRRPETTRSPRFLGNPCVRAEVLDPAGVGALPSAEPTPTR